MTVQETYQAIKQTGRDILWCEKENKWKIFKLPWCDELPMSKQLQEEIKQCWSELKEICETNRKSPLPGVVPKQSRKKAATVSPTTAKDLSISCPEIKPQQQTLFDNIPAEGWESDSKNKKDVATPRKKGDKSKAEEILKDSELYTQSNLETLIRLRDSHRLPNLDHWFVVDVSRGWERSQDLRVPRICQFRLQKIFTEYTNDKYLDYIDKIFEAVAGKDGMKSVRYRSWCRKDGFEALKNNFRELNMYCGQVELVEIDQTGGLDMVTSRIEAQHCWMVAPDGGIVDPSWKLAPGRIFTYEGVAML